MKIGRFEGGFLKVLGMRILQSNHGSFELIYLYIILVFPHRINGLRRGFMLKQNNKIFKSYEIGQFWKWLNGAEMVSSWKITFA